MTVENLTMLLRLLGLPQTVSSLHKRPAVFMHGHKAVQQLR